MKRIDWNPDKNEQLKIERGVSFEDVCTSISNGDVLAIVEHPNKQKYQHQMVLVVKIEEYAYIVPFVEDDEKYFLKTIIPSRQETKRYLIKDKKI